MYIPEYTCTMEMQENYVMPISNASENKVNILSNNTLWIKNVKFTIMAPS